MEGRQSQSPPMQSQSPPTAWEDEREGRSMKGSDRHERSKSVGNNRRSSLFEERRRQRKEELQRMAASGDGGDDFNLDALSAELRSSSPLFGSGQLLTQEDIEWDPMTPPKEGKTIAPDGVKPSQKAKTKTNSPLTKTSPASSNVRGSADKEQASPARGKGALSPPQRAQGGKIVSASPRKSSTTGGSNPALTAKLMQTELELSEARTQYGAEVRRHAEAEEALTVEITEKEYELEEMKQRLQEDDRVISELRSHLEHVKFSAKRDLHQMQLELSKKDEEIKELANAAEMEATIAQERHRAEIAELRGKIENVEQEKTAAVESIRSQHQKMMEDAQKNTDSDNQLLLSRQAEEYESIIEGLKQELSATKDALEQTKTEVKSSMSKSQCVDKEKEQLTQQLERVSAQYAAAEETNGILQEKVSKLQEEMSEKLIAHNDVLRMVVGLQAEVKALSDENGELKASQSSSQVVPQPDRKRPTPPKHHPSEATKPNGTSGEPSPQATQEALNAIPPPTGAVPASANVSSNRSSVGRSARSAIPPPPNVKSPPNVATAPRITVAAAGIKERGSAMPTSIKSPKVSTPSHVKEDSKGDETPKGDQDVGGAKQSKLMSLFKNKDRSKRGSAGSSGSNEGAVKGSPKVAPKGKVQAAHRATSSGSVSLQQSDVLIHRPTSESFVELLSLAKKHPDYKNAKGNAVNSLSDRLSAGCGEVDDTIAIKLGTIVFERVTSQMKVKAPEAYTPQESFQWSVDGVLAELKPLYESAASALNKGELVDAALATLEILAKEVRLRLFFPRGNGFSTQAYEAAKSFMRMVWRTWVEGLNSLKLNKDDPNTTFIARRMVALDKDGLLDPCGEFAPLIIEAIKTSK